MGLKGGVINSLESSMLKVLFTNNGGIIQVIMEALFELSWTGGII